MVTAIAPFSVDASSPVGWLVYLLIGVGFGAALEMAGFSYAPNLAAQFYGRDMRVLKTMFTAIVTAMVLIFLSSAVGLLDFRMVSVSTTYLRPGIVGGLVMGAGFVVGGFCPGTSLAAAATGSRDALVYLAGLGFGIAAFGETVESFRGFWESAELGRFTIPEWLGIPTGAVVIGVVVMALGVFALVEWIERRLQSPVPRSSRRFALGMAGLAVVLAVATAAAGQPGWEEHWEMVAAEQQVHLDDRDVYIAPGELAELMHGDENLVMLDVRDQAAYDHFHIVGARPVGADLDAMAVEISDLTGEPPGTIFVTVDTSEERSTDVWRLLTAENVPNAYILGGGLNTWLAVFGPDEVVAADPAPDAWMGLTYEHKIVAVTETGGDAPAGGGCG